MRALGSLLIAIIVGLVAIWLFVKLVFFTLKLVVVLIGVALAVIAFFVVQRLIGGPRRA
jgi:hypothetical protein